VRAKARRVYRRRQLPQYRALAQAPHAQGPRCWAVRRVGSQGRSQGSTQGCAQGCAHGCAQGCAQGCAPGCALGLLLTVELDVTGPEAAIESAVGRIWEHFQGASIWWSTTQATEVGSAGGLLSVTAVSDSCIPSAVTACHSCFLRLPLHLAV